MNTELLEVYRAVNRVDVFIRLSKLSPPQTETGLHPQVTGERNEYKAQVFDIVTEDEIDTEVDNGAA